MADPAALPAYAREGTDIRSSIQHLLSSTEGVELPIKFYPPRDCPWNEEAVSLGRNIIGSFFDAIRNKNQEVVAMMVEGNLITPNTTDFYGQTPLLVAVEDGSIRMVQCLVDFGAEIDGFGNFMTSQRTPLQLAASTGHLALVRLFIEVFHADDSIVAPDGELALRLAAANGHYDVVRYLPLRRGGGWQRWKTQHDKAIQRMQEAVFSIYKYVKAVVWDTPRFFVWSCPKHVIVLPGKRGLVWCWKYRHAFGPWCKKQMQEIPQRIKRATVAVENWLKTLPVVVTRKLTQARSYLVSLFSERIPATLRHVWEWLKHGAKAVADSVVRILKRTLSFLHSAFVYIVSLFRSLTLKDVWNGLYNILHEVFVQFPLKLWSWIEKLPKMTLDALMVLFGELGEIAWWIGWALIHIIIYVPRKLFVIGSSLGGSVTKGCHEILVWMDPKR